MSEWCEIQDEDIEFDKNEKEVNLLITNNQFGNVYGTLTFDQIIELNKKIKSIKNES